MYELSYGLVKRAAEKARIEMLVNSAMNLISEDRYTLQEVMSFMDAPKREKKEAIRIIHEKLYSLSYDEPVHSDRKESHSSKGFNRNGHT